MSADVCAVPVARTPPLGPTWRAVKRMRGSSDGQLVALAKAFRRLDQGSTPQQPVPFDIRERRNVARILRRTRLRNFVGTVMVMLLLACGLFALTVIRLSSDPNYIKPW
jgi:hypothetical protein